MKSKDAITVTVLKRNSPRETIKRDSKGNIRIVRKSPRTDKFNQPLPPSKYSKATSAKKISKINAMAKSKELKSIKFHSGNLNPKKGATRDYMKFELDMMKKELKKNKVNAKTDPKVKARTRALNESKSGPSVAKKNVNVKRGAANKAKAQGMKAMSGPTSGYGRSTRPRGK